MSIRNAEKQDIDFIVTMIQEEAKSGHFNNSLASKDLKIREGVEHQISTTISKGIMQTSSISNKASHIYIYEKNGKALAFCWLSGHSDSDKYTNEVYMIAVKKEFRRQGVGRALIEDAMKKMPDESKMYARIYSNSLYMRDLITNKGFEEYSRTTAVWHFVYEK